MGRIAVLPAFLANQIAAGEVIERPASVVKELVENSLDAGAHRVGIAVRGGGCQQIIVRDDGEGMTREDAALAFARHSTSKLRHPDDLMGIGSFGFRGEALPSIAAAADVELLTRRSDEDTGTRVRVRGGVLTDVAEAGSPPGTQLEVSDLFAALPARRKFLKRPATEFGHVAEVVNRLALGVPRVGFVLQHEGREVLNFPPVARPADRLLQVVGRDGGGDMLAFEVTTPALAVEGYLGRPEHSLSSARLVLAYVNGRLVRDRVITRAVLDGYESVLMRGRYPIAVVFLSVAKGDVDVNVHPAKAEVRFREPGRIHQVLTGAIRSRLRDAAGAAGPRTQALSQPPRSVGRRPGGGGVPSWTTDPARDRWPARTWDLDRQAPSISSGERQEPPQVQDQDASYQIASGQRLDQQPPDGTDAPPEGLPALRLGASGRFAALRVLGQVLDGYLVCDSGRGLVLIDQHAAHERVRFERLRGQLESGQLPVQHLLVPQPLTLGARDVEALEEAREALGRLGFEGERFGEGVYLVRSVPAVLADADCAVVLRDVAAELAEIGASSVVEGAVEAVLARVACHSAVRVGRHLDRAEAEALLRSMDEVDLASYCPHGRPAFVELDAASLERMFKR